MMPGELVFNETSRLAIFKCKDDSNKEDSIRVAVRYLISTNRRITLRNVQHVCGRYSFETIGKVLKGMRDEIQIYHSAVKSFKERYSHNHTLGEALRNLDIEGIIGQPSVNRKINELFVSVCREALKQIKSTKKQQQVPPEW